MLFSQYNIQIKMMAVQNYCIALMFNAFSLKLVCIDDMEVYFKFFKIIFRTYT